MAAEIVGLASGIVALIGTAKAAGKVAKEIRRIRSDAKWAKKDIQNLQIELKQYESSVTATEFALSLAYNDPSNSEVVRFLEQEQFNHLLIQSSEGIGERIRDARDRLPNLRGTPIPVIAKWLVWSLSAKKELMELRPRLESVKTWLSVILHSVQMTLLCKEQETPKLRQQIKRLQRIIDSQIKTILILKSQIGVSQTVNGTQTAPDTIYASDVILNLARSVRDTGRVPEQPQLTWSTTHREARRRQRQRGLDVDTDSNIPSIRGDRTPTQVLAEVSGPVPEVPRAPRRRVGRQSLRRPSEADTGDTVERTVTIQEEATEQPEVISPTVEVAYNQPAEHESGSSSVDEGECLCHPSATDSHSEAFPPTASSVSSVPPTFNMSPTGSTFGAESPTTPLSPTAPPNAIGEEHREVRPRSHILDPQQTEEGAVDGYILVPGTLDRRHVTALIDPALKKNLMSAAKARDLGLEIIPVGSACGEMHILSEENGRFGVGLIMGSVELTWWPTVTNYPPGFGQRFWVCHQMDHDILLGEPFLNRGKD